MADRVKWCETIQPSTKVHYTVHTLSKFNKS